MSNPIPLKELSSGLIINKSIIPCIEGRFTKMFSSKPQERSFKGENPYTQHDQGGEITDSEGTVHSIKISSTRQPTTYDRGDTVYRISCKDSGKGLKGVSMNTWPDKKTGQEKRQIAVDADKALIECVSGNATKQAQAPKTTQQAHSPAKSSPPARIGMQIGNAINNATLLLVHGLIPVGEHGAISSLEDTAKEMLLMSDRLEGFTGKLETPPAEKLKEKEQDKLQLSNTATNWKTVVHPTRRITLLEIAQNHTYEFYQMLATALKGGTVADSDKEVFNGLLACISEREMTPEKIARILIWKHPNYGSVFEEKEITEAIEAVTGQAHVNGLSNNDWKLVLSQYQQILEELNSK